MPNNERSLVAFTLLTQLAIGAFWALATHYFWATDQIDIEAASALTTPGFLAIIPLMALALLVSLLHLGKPRNSWRAIINLRTSWLSREIFFTLLFAMSEACFALLQWGGGGEAWLQALFCVGAAMAGGLSVYSMIRLYMLRTIISWNSLRTATSFVTSTFLLGCLAAGIMLIFNPEARGSLLRVPMVSIALAAVLLSVARLVITKTNPVEKQPTLQIIHICLIALALSTSSILFYQSVVFNYAESITALTSLAILAFLASLAEESIGRDLFYRSFKRTGL